MHARHDTGTSPNPVRIHVRLALWMLAWLVTLSVGRFGPVHLWDQSAVSWAVIAVNVIVGIGLIVAHARYLQQVDELQRKIMLDAMAITLGVGFVGGFAYLAADAADVVTQEVAIGMFPALLGIVYVIAAVAGTIRYR